MVSAQKRIAPAALRNVLPIGDVLASFLLEDDTIFEFASGTGQHIAAFSQRFAQCTWYPSELNAVDLQSIAAYRQESAALNFKAPRIFDVSGSPTFEMEVDVVLAINLLHITSQNAVEGLFRNAARMLKTGGRLITYGPYRFFGQFSAESNADFDRQLRARDRAWGVRDLSDLGLFARRYRLILHSVIACPAQNHVLVFKKLT